MKNRLALVAMASFAHHHRSGITAAQPLFLNTFTRQRDGNLWYALTL